MWYDKTIIVVIVKGKNTVGGLRMKRELRLYKKILIPILLAFVFIMTSLFSYVRTDAASISGSDSISGEPSVGPQGTGVQETDVFPYDSVQPQIIPEERNQPSMEEDYFDDPSIDDEAVLQEDTYDSISVKKTFDCTEGGEPLDVTFTLSIDGIEYDSITMESSDFEEDAPDTWICEKSFEPISDTDLFLQSATYELEEDELDDYEASISEFDPDTASFDVVNTYVAPEPETMTMFLKQIWDGEAANGISVSLYQDEDCMKLYDTYDISPFNCQVDGNTWYYEFPDLPVVDEDGNSYHYTIVEDELDGYTSSSPVEINKGIMMGWEITSTKDEPQPDPEPEMVTKFLKKYWVGEPAEFIDINMYQDAEHIQLYDSYHITPENCQVGDDYWYYEFTDLPETDEEGNLYDYTIQEEYLEGYSTTDPVEVMDGDLYGWEITNTKENPQPTTETLFLKKVWKGNQASSIKVTLYLDNKYKEKYQTYEISYSDCIVDGNTWYYKFTDLPILDEEGNPISYYIKEKALEGYTSSEPKVIEEGGLYGWKITNTEDTPEEFYDSIGVTKIWDGGEPLISITFDLYKDGKKMDTITIHNADTSSSSMNPSTSKDTQTSNITWYGEFHGKYPKGHKYTLKESVAGYDISEYNYKASGLTDFDKKNGSFTVTNTYTGTPSPEPDPDVFSLKILKMWYGPPQDSITVTLYTNKACTKKYKSYVITPENCYDGSEHIWWYEITGLPGNQTFWMEETPMNGYKTEYGDLIFNNGWYINNTYDGKSVYDTTSKSAKTGDDNNLMLYIGILIVALAGITVAIVVKKKRR